MVIIQALPELDDRYTPVFKRGTRESGWPHQAVRRYGGDVLRLLQRRAGDEWVYIARAKRARVLGDWIDGTPVQDIEAQYTAQARYPLARGDIQGIADTTRFHLSSAYKIVSMLRPETSPEPERMDERLARLEVGLPGTTLRLLECPIVFSRGEYLALAGVGVQTLDALKGAAAEQLQQALAPDRAAAVQQWQEREALPRSK